MNQDPIFIVSFETLRNILEQEKYRRPPMQTKVIYHDYMERWEVPPTFTPRVKAFIAGAVIAVALAGLFLRAMQ